MVMNVPIRQGDILNVERIKLPVLVVSKNFFNQSGEVIGCPIYHEGKENALRIPINTNKTTGFVHCEKLALLDLRVRGHSKIDEIQISDIMNITDAVQGIFDYI